RVALSRIDGVDEVLLARVVLDERPELNVGRELRPFGHGTAQAEPEDVADEAASQPHDVDLSLRVRIGGIGGRLGDRSETAVGLWRRDRDRVAVRVEDRYRWWNRIAVSPAGETGGAPVGVDLPAVGQRYDLFGGGPVRNQRDRRDDYDGGHPPSDGRCLRSLFSQCSPLRRVV